MTKSKFQPLVDVSKERRLRSLSIKTERCQWNITHSPLPRTALESIQQSHPIETLVSIGFYHEKSFCQSVEISFQESSSRWLTANRIGTQLTLEIHPKFKTWKIREP